MKLSKIDIEERYYVFKKYTVTRITDPSSYEFSKETPVKELLNLMDMGFFMSSGTVIYETDYEGNHIKRVPFKYENVAIGDNVFTFADTGCSYSIRVSTSTITLNINGIITIVEEMVKVNYVPREDLNGIFNQLPRPSRDMSLIEYLWRVVESTNVKIEFKSNSMSSECKVFEFEHVWLYDFIHVIKRKYFKSRIK